MPTLGGGYDGSNKRLLANIRSEYGADSVPERFFASFELEPGKVLIETHGREAPPRQPKDSKKPRVIERIYRVVAEGGESIKSTRRFGFLHEVFVAEGCPKVKVGAGRISNETLKGEPGAKCSFFIVRRGDIFATRIAL